MKLKTIESSALPIGVTVGVVLADLLTSVARAWLTKPSTAAVVSIVVIAASIELVKFFAENLFDHCKFIRRMLLRDQYLEGTWFDIMRVDGKPTEVGLSWLGYENWEVKYTGEDYDLKYDSGGTDLAMTHRFPYTGEKVVYSKDNKLLYKYTADRSDRNDPEIAGYGELQFHPGQRGIPTRYSGHYLRPEGDAKLRKVSFEGFRLDEKKHREYLNRINDAETRKDAIRDLLRRFGD